MAEVSTETEILCTYFGGLQLHFREFFLDYLGIDTSFVGNDTENPEMSYSMELYLQTFYRNRHCAKSVRIHSFSGPYFASFGLNTERWKDSWVINVFHVNIRSSNSDAFLKNSCY